VSIGTMNIVSPEYFGTSQSVRVIQIAMSDSVGSGPHLLTVDDPLVTVLHRPRGDATDVGAAPGSDMS
jgi:hypothetical protein